MCDKSRINFISGLVGSYLIITHLQKALSEQWLAPGTSPVDWCEENYVVSRHIAEFANTITNLPLIVVPALTLYTKAWSSYATHVHQGIYVQLVISAIVGFGSILFHGSLSLIGQMLDEMAIIWYACMGYAVLCPDKYRPSFCAGAKGNIIAVVTMLCLTISWFIDPILNPFWLFSTTVPAFGVVCWEAFIKHTNVKTTKYARIIVFSFLFSLICWSGDKIACDTWLRLGTPGLHWFFHILAGIANYYTLVMFAFLRADLDMCNIKPSIKHIKYFSIPYVHCEARRKKY